MYNECMILLRAGHRLFFVVSPRTMSSWAENLRKGIGRGLAFLGAGATVSSLVLINVRYRALQADRELPPSFVLELPLERLSLVERLSANPLAVISGAGRNQVELRQVVSALRHSAGDERCRGVVTVLGGRENLGGLASVQELRDALLSYRTTAAAAGRRDVTTAAFTSSFGEAGASGMLPYTVATASERVFVQPSGMLGLTGLSSRSFFLRDLLDRFGVVPYVFAREQYKSAANGLIERGFTGPQRENLGALVGDMAEQMLSAMSSGRGVPTSTLRTALETAPLKPTAATRMGLLDGVKYRDEVHALFPSKPSDTASSTLFSASSTEKPAPADSPLPRVSIDKYIRVREVAAAATVATSGGAGWLSGTAFEGLVLLVRGKVQEAIAAESGRVGPRTDPLAAVKPPRVAVVSAVGTIVQGPVALGPAAGKVVDATQLSSHLTALLDDSSVRAVVLRVNSPGGSALASDTLHHEIMRLRDAGKPVIVSMGDVAASGGYYLATAADRILAQPGTLTGSIGVVTGKVHLSPLLQERLGVSSEAVTVGANAEMLSPFTGLSEQQEATVNDLIDHVYEDFLQKVSRSRKRPVEEVRQLAKGRVYTGRQAYDLGLVDELGGLEAAVQAAKRAAGLPEDVLVEDFPRQQLPLLLRLLRATGVTGNGEGAAGGGGGGGRRAAWGMALEWLVLGGGGEEGAGTMDANEAVAAVVGGGGGVHGGSGSGGELSSRLVEELGLAVGLLGSGPQMYSAEAAMLARVA